VKRDRRSAPGVRITALWLAAIALTFYLGFILLGMIKA
jgi:hypothetical protein